MGEHLKQLRYKIRLSQRDVANLCEVDVSTVSRWERGLHQHTHRSRDKAIRRAFEALSWAAELQDEEPNRVLTFEDLDDYIKRRRRLRRGGAGRV